MKKLLPLLLPLFIASACLSQETNKSNPAIVPATRSSPGNWLARHEGFVKQAKSGGIDLLFVGDSITDFWRNKGSNVWAKFYGDRHAANFGISGDRTQHV